MTAIVRYNRIAHEEAALKLARQLRDFGIGDATPLFAPEEQQSIQLGDTLYSWDHVNKLCGFGEKVTLKVTRLPHGADLDLPRYETRGAAGMDLRAAIPEGEVITLLPGQRKLIPTGLAFACPPGYEVQVRPRSGLALKHGISIVNAPGTVDSDYRGEVGCVLINQGQEAFSIRRGDRIGQMVVCPVVQAVWDEVETLDETERGAGGYGSTGRG